MEAIGVVLKWLAYMCLGYAFVMGVLGLGCFLVFLGSFMLLMSI